MSLPVNSTQMKLIRSMAQKEIKSIKKLIDKSKSIGLDPSLFEMAVKELEDLCNTIGRELGE